MSRYAYGYCGMPCALCTRYRTEGDSRCPGCSCDGYYTVPCKVHRCVREKGLDHCGQCGDFPCPKLGKMGDFRDLNTGRVKERKSPIFPSLGQGKSPHAPQWSRPFSRTQRWTLQGSV